MAVKGRSFGSPNSYYVLCGGKQQLLTNQPVNQLLTITETPDEPTLLIWVSVGTVFLLLVLAGFWAYRRYRA